MRKYAVLLLSVLMLSGCASPLIYPERAVDGAEWDKSWLMHGAALGIEAADGFTLLENYAVLTMEGISTSVWGAGIPVSVSDSDGNERDEYAAQVYVLVRECADEASARRAVEDWKGHLAESWSVADTREETENGQTYQVMDCRSLSADSLYTRELAALSCTGACAVSVELDCTASFDGDAAAVLTEFLRLCHYSAA